MAAFSAWGIFGLGSMAEVVLFATGLRSLEELETMGLPRVRLVLEAEEEATAAGPPDGCPKSF